MLIMNGNASPHPQGVHPSAPSAPPAPGSKEPSYGFPMVPPQPQHPQGYQGYFYQGCPPPHQCIPPPHCRHHHESHCHSHATLSLEQCFYALCCCYLCEDCCL